MLFSLVEFCHKPNYSFWSSFDLMPLVCSLLIGLTIFSLLSLIHILEALGYKLLHAFSFVFSIPCIWVALVWFGIQSSLAVNGLIFIQFSLVN